MARPSKYTAEYLAKAKEYLFNWKELGHMIPSAVGLADYLEVAESTVYEHANKHKEFSEILRRINSKQQLELINGGLSNQLNANIAKLVLGKHGYHDKQDQQVTTAQQPTINVSMKQPVEPEGKAAKDKAKLKVVK